MDFEAMFKMLREEFDQINRHGSNIGFGNAYYIGNTFNDGDKVKLDLMYTDPFLNEPDEIDGVRLSRVPLPSPSQCH